MAKQTQEFVNPGVIVTTEKGADGSTRTMAVVGGVVFVALSVIGSVWLILDAEPFAAYILAGGGAVGMALFGGAVWRRSNQINEHAQKKFDDEQETTNLNLRQLTAEVGKSESELGEQKAKTRGAWAAATKLEYDAHLFQFGKDIAVVDMPRRVTVNVIRHQTPAQQRELLTLPEPEAEPDKLIDVLRKQFCMAIEGGRDAGKTVCALWWASFRTDGDLMIADPKGFGINPWPANAWVASDETSIVEMVRRVALELKRRRDNELFNQRPIYLLVDELQWLVEENEARPGLPIMQPFFTLITFGREFGVHASCTTGDGGVESLKIKGKSGLKRGLVWVEINLNPMNGERTGYIKHKPGQVFPVELPGVFAGRNQARRFKVQRSAAPAQSKTAKEIEDEKTAAWIAAVKNGELKGAACERIFQRGYGGNFAQSLRKALDNS